MHLDEDETFFQNLAWHNTSWLQLMLYYRDRIKIDTSFRSRLWHYGLTNVTTSETVVLIETVRCHIHEPNLRNIFFSINIFM